MSSVKQTPPAVLIAQGHLNGFLDVRGQQGGLAHTHLCQAPWCGESPGLWIHQAGQLRPGAKT